MLTPQKPRTPERPTPRLNERPDTDRNKNATPASDATVPLEPHWAALVDGATD